MLSSVHTQINDASIFYVYIYDISLCYKTKYSVSKIFYVQKIFYLLASKEFSFFNSKIFYLLTNYFNIFYLPERHYIYFCLFVCLSIYLFVFFFIFVVSPSPSLSLSLCCAIAWSVLPTCFCERGMQSMPI